MTLSSTAPFVPYFVQRQTVEALTPISLAKSTRLRVSSAGSCDVILVPSSETEFNCGQVPIVRKMRSLRFELDAPLHHQAEAAVDADGEGSPIISQGTGTGKCRRTLGN